MALGHPVFIPPLHACFLRVPACPWRASRNKANATHGKVHSPAPPALWTALAATEITGMATARDQQGHLKEWSDKKTTSPHGPHLTPNLSNPSHKQQTPTTRCVFSFRCKWILLLCIRCRGRNGTAIGGTHRPDTRKHWQSQNQDGAGLMDMWLQVPAVHSLHTWVKLILAFCM